jgi:hypothetical protein
MCCFRAYNRIPNFFSSYCFHKKNILHLSHVLKQKLDIVTGL